MATGKMASGKSSGLPPLTTPVKKRNPRAKQPVNKIVVPEPTKDQVHQEDARAAMSAMLGNVCTCEDPGEVYPDIANKAHHMADIMGLVRENGEILPVPSKIDVSGIIQEEWQTAARVRQFNVNLAMFAFGCFVLGALTYKIRSQVRNERSNNNHYWNGRSEGYHEGFMEASSRMQPV